MVRAYYGIKPYIPIGLRRMFRRRQAAAVRKQHEATWPIDESAATVPENWPGWPGGKDFAVVLTHDVESSRGVRRVKQLARLVQRHGLVSSFNFIPEGGYRTPPELRHWLRGIGFEVGVHDLVHDGKLFNSREGFREKAERINGYLREWDAVGFRSGFMLRRLDWLSDLDISYDASTFDTDPFEPQPDGCGTIFPFTVPSENGSGDCVELPYTLAQDSTVFLLLGERTPEIWKRKLDWIAGKGGLVLMNIHPDYIHFRRNHFSSSFYPEEVLDEFFGYLRSAYGGRFWNPLPREMASWYRSTHPVRSSLS